jgi:hypothetical protein
MWEMKEVRNNPNPAGREGKPFSLYPHTFDEVVQKMLTTPPPPKHETKTAQKPTSKKASKKR